MGVHFRSVAVVAEVYLLLKLRRLSRLPVWRCALNGKSCQVCNEVVIEVESDKARTVTAISFYSETLLGIRDVKIVWHKC